MTREIAKSREHLAANRRLILGRAIASAAAGAVPIPLVDDWMADTTLSSAYRRIADSRQVDVDATAVKNLVQGRTEPVSLLSLANNAVFYRVATRGIRRAVLALTVLRRARAAASNFVHLTLFDHYCARLHRGAGLDAHTALELRELMALAIAQTPGGLSLGPFRRGLALAARATARAPLELADTLSGGRLRRLLGAGADVAPAEMVSPLDRLIDTAVADETSFPGRALAAIEVQLSAEGNPYIDAILTRFESLWRGRHP